MILHDTLISVLRCQHCLVMFALTVSDKMSLRPDRQAILTASPCPVCGKTEVDYIGELGVSERHVEPPR